MQVKITGKHLDIGDALRANIEERLQALRERYFEGSVHATVTLEKQRGRYLADCMLHLATGLILQSHTENADPTVAAGAAVSHLEKQLKKYKQRLKDHHRAPREARVDREVASYVIQSEEHGEEEPTGFHAPIIAESSAAIPALSVGEAVMQLDISTTPFVLFHNSKEGRLNVVYRRPDGNIGWLDPKSSAQRVNA